MLRDHVAFNRKGLIFYRSDTTEYLYRTDFLCVLRSQASRYNAAYDDFKTVETDPERERGRR